MIATMVYKLTKDATPQQMREAGLGEHYVITMVHFFTTMQQAIHGRLPIFKQKAIQLLIYMKILLLKKRPELPING